MLTSKTGWQASLCLLGWLSSYAIALQISLTAIAAPSKFKLPPPPPRGNAGHRSAAASRNQCPAVSPPLTALVPKYQPDRVWGLTGMAHPTIWFYLPYPQESIVDLSFILQDESNPSDTQIIYENPRIIAARSPGLLKVTIPNSIAPLTPTKSYHWFLKLNLSCTIGQRPIYVDGWIQRQEVAPDLRAQLDRASPAARVKLYTEQGLWYDALNISAALYPAKPQDSIGSQDWRNLLESIELGDLIDH